MVRDYLFEPVKAEGIEDEAGDRTYRLQVVQGLHSAWRDAAQLLTLMALG